MSLLYTTLSCQHLSCMPPCIAINGDDKKWDAQSDFALKLARNGARETGNRQPQMEYGMCHYYTVPFEKFIWQKEQRFVMEYGILNHMNPSIEPPKIPIKFVSNGMSRTPPSRTHLTLVPYSIFTVKITLSFKQVNNGSNGKSNGMAKSCSICRSKRNNITRSKNTGSLCHRY